MNLATALIIGKLTHDPEGKTVNMNGNQKLNVSFQIAVNSFKKDGKTSFFKCEAWDKQAQIIIDYAKKGSELLVQGELKHETWTNQEGEKREKVKIVASSVQLGNKKKEEDPFKGLPLDDEEEDVF